MKRNNLYIGLLSMSVGSMFLVLALNIESSPGILFGLSGSALIGGLSLIWKYFYWSSPKRKGTYEVRCEEEQINLKDEFKESLRNRSGRIAYIITFLVISISIIVFSILGSLGVLDTKLLVLYLSNLWIFMYVIGIIIFRVLMKKYQ